MFQSSTLFGGGGQRGVLCQLLQVYLSGIFTPTRQIVIQRPWGWIVLRVTKHKVLMDGFSLLCILGSSNKRVGLNWAYSLTVGASSDVNKSATSPGSTVRGLKHCKYRGFFKRARERPRRVIACKLAVLAELSSLTLILVPSSRGYPFSFCRLPPLFSPSTDLSEPCKITRAF